jgi:hypothetical protein
MGTKMLACWKHTVWINYRYSGEEEPESAFICVYVPPMLIAEKDKERSTFVPIYFKAPSFQSLTVYIKDPLVYKHKAFIMLTRFVDLLHAFLASLFLSARISFFKANQSRCLTSHSTVVLDNRCIIEQRRRALLIRPQVLQLLLLLLKQSPLFLQVHYDSSYTIRSQFGCRGHSQKHSSLYNVLGRYHL